MDHDLEQQHRNNMREGSFVGLIAGPLLLLLIFVAFLMMVGAAPVVEMTASVPPTPTEAEAEAAATAE